MKFMRDFGVRAFLATLLVLILAIVVIPPALAGKLDTIQAAQIISPLTLAGVMFYFGQHKT